MIKNIEHFEGLTCTINTTEDCNLRCKYCYEIGKHSCHDISLDKCIKFIDLIFDTEDPANLKDDPSELSKGHLYEGIVLDFIGGDSLINPKLLDQICRYFNYKWSCSNKFKKRGWRFSISTNGTLFVNPEVREFCEKWKNNLHVGVSIDGCPEIHDANRVFKDGTGSMSTILKWWPWYKEVFPEASLSTKATCSKNTIPYLYESLKWMHEILGLKYIHQNFIMEDTGCVEEDYELLDQQLGLCCNYCLEHGDDLYWSMLDHRLFHKGKKLLDDPEAFTRGRCGSGRMPCLSLDGKIYSCFRWLPHTQQFENIMSVGNIKEGFITKENYTKVQKGSIRSNCTRDPKCLDCEYESSCAYCIAGCFAEFGDFVRTTHICEITKLQCKWAEILQEKENIRK